MSHLNINWPELSLQVMITLGHFLWQGCLVAIILTVAQRLSSAIAGRAAKNSYAIACVAFFALPLCVGVTFAKVHQSRGPVVMAASESDESPIRVATADVPVLSANDAEIPLSQRAEVGPMPEFPAATSIQPPTEARQPEPHRSEATAASWAQKIQPWAPWLAIAYAVGVCLMLGRFGLSLVGSSRIRKSLQPITDSHLLNIIAQQASQLSLKRVPLVALCQRVNVPVVVGILKPVILLPPALLSGLDPNQFASVLSHEMAHIRRYDLLVNLLQRMVEALLFFHPVTWWISRRISIERENCCDDLAATANGSLPYANALLRMAELCLINQPKKIASLATLSATGGSPSQLVHRIRRLIGAENRVQLGVSRRGIGLAFAMTLVASVSLVAWGQNREPADDKSTKEEGVPSIQWSTWGKESDGLQCRIVPVSPLTDAENIDMAASVKQFASPDDIAFAVEIKNVSDKAISLQDVRYGEGYADETRGKLNANHYAPHLFDFIFTGVEGKSIARPHREFSMDSHALILRGALVTQLDPGESLKCVLTPARFERSMDYRLPPGDYRVQVRYRGPSKPVKDWIKKHNVGQDFSKVWASEVTSGATSISVLSEGFREPDLVWGAETDGLRAALEIRVPREAGIPTQAPGVPTTTTLQPILHVRNVTDKPITFVSETGRQGDTLKIKDANGKDVKVKDVWFSGWPIDVRWTLQPGDVAELDVLTPSLKQGLTPGEYSARYTIRFNSRQLEDKEGNQVFPAPSDYDSEIDTGWTPLFLRDPKQPLPDQTSANADRTDASSDGGESANVKVPGNDENWGTVPQTCRGKAYSSTAKSVNWKVDEDNRVMRASATDGMMTTSALPYPGADFSVSVTLQLADNSVARLKVGDQQFDVSQSATESKLVNAGKEYTAGFEEKTPGWTSLRVSRRDGESSVEVNRQPVIDLGSRLKAVEQISLQSTRGTIAVRNFAVNGNVQERKAPNTTIHGRVINADGQPIADASISCFGYAGDKLNAFDPVFVETDQNGHFSATAASRIFKVGVGSPNDTYDSIRGFSVRNGQAICQHEGVEDRSTDEQINVVVTLSRRYSLSFDLVDADTDQPVKNAAILYKEDESTWFGNGDSDYATGATWATYQVIENGQSAFQEYTSPVMNQANIRVFATGYAPVSLKLSEELERGEPIVVPIRMKAVAPIELALKTVNAAPAVGAVFATQKPRELSYALRHRGSKGLKRILAIDAKTNELGVASFPQPGFGDWASYRIKHPAGHVDFNVSDLPTVDDGAQVNKFELELIANGTLQGRYLPKVRKNEFLEVYRLQPNRIKVDQPAGSLVKLNSDGRFVISDQLAGWYTFVHRTQVTDADGGQGTRAIGSYGPFRLKGGETRELALGASGRSLIGKLSLPANGPLDYSKLTIATASNHSFHYPREPRGLDEEASLSWWNDYRASDVGHEHREYEDRNITVRVAADGSFYFPSLPAGKYELRVNSKTRLLTQSLEIPAHVDNSPYDLGTLTLGEPPSASQHTRHGDDHTSGHHADETPTWVPVRPKKARSSPAGTVRILDDNSVRLGGDVPYQETKLQYAFDHPTTLEEVRLEILAVNSPSGPQYGRGGKKLILFDVKPSIDGPNAKVRQLEFSSCIYQQNPRDESTANCIDFLSDTGWTVPTFADDTPAHTLILRLRKPVQLNAEQRLTLAIDSGGTNDLALLNRVRFAFKQQEPTENGKRDKAVPPIAEPIDPDDENAAVAPTHLRQFKLVDGESGTPLQGIEGKATLFKQGTPNKRRAFKSNEQGIVEIEVAEGEGAWIPEVPSGWFTSAPSVTVVEVDENGKPKHEQTAVNDEEPTVVNLWQGTEVGGRLLWPDKTPAAGVRLTAGVYIHSQNWKQKLGMDLTWYSFDHGDWPNWRRTITTDEAGRFRVTVPPSQSRAWLRVGTTSLGFTPQIGAGESKAITQRLAKCVPLEIEYGGSGRNNIPTFPDNSTANNGLLHTGDLQLVTGVIVRGRVVDAEGNGLSQVHLTTTGPHGPHGGRKAISGEGGEFEFPAMAAGNLTVHPNARLRDAEGPRPGSVSSREVQAVFVDQSFRIVDMFRPNEITIRAVPHTEVTFDWIDRRADKTQPIAYYGYFRVRGHMPGADGKPKVYWTGETYRTQRNGKPILAIKIPTTLVKPELVLVADRRVTASYSDSTGTRSGPGQVPLGDITANTTRTIYGDEPAERKSSIRQSLKE